MKYAKRFSDLKQKRENQLIAQRLRDFSNKQKTVDCKAQSASIQSFSMSYVSKNVHSKIAKMNWLLAEERLTWLNKTYYDSSDLRPADLSMSWGSRLPENDTEKFIEAMPKSHGNAIQDVRAKIYNDRVPLACYGGNVKKNESVNCYRKAKWE